MSSLVTVERTSSGSEQRPLAYQATLTRIQMKKILLLLWRERRNCIVFVIYMWKWSIYFRIPVSIFFSIDVSLALFFQLMQPGYRKREETLFHTCRMESHRRKTKNKYKIIVHYHFKTSFRLGNLTTKAFIAIRKIKTQGFLN